MSAIIHISASLKNVDFFSTGEFQPRRTFREASYRTHRKSLSSYKARANLTQMIYLDTS
jgi:hypothetical protein